MAAGFELYNANGTLQFSTNNRMMRVLTVADTGTGNGSVTNASLSEGTALVGASSAEGKKAPTITVTGNTVSWSFGSTPTAERGNTHLSIMVY